MAITFSIAFAVSFFGVGLFSHPNVLAQAEPFYKGKTLRVIVAFSPGGAYDTWARMITKHLDKYIPGNPAIIVSKHAGRGFDYRCKLPLQYRGARWLNSRPNFLGALF